MQPQLLSARVFSERHISPLWYCRKASRECVYFCMHSPMCVCIHVDGVISTSFERITRWLCSKGEIAKVNDDEELTGLMCN